MRGWISSARTWGPVTLMKLCHDLGKHLGGDRDSVSKAEILGPF